MPPTIVVSDTDARALLVVTDAVTQTVFVAVGADGVRVMPLMAGAET